MTVTGWTELISGDIFGAIMALFESYYGDWFITILFIIFKIMVWFSTSSGGSGNLTLGLMISLIFLGVFYSTINPVVVGTVVALTVVELGAVLYSLIFKK
jgi:hypothetical protein